MDVTLSKIGRSTPMILIENPFKFNDTLKEVHQIIVVALLVDLDILIY